MRYYNIAVWGIIDTLGRIDVTLWAAISLSAQSVESVQSVVWTIIVGAVREPPLHGFPNTSTIIFSQPIPFPSVHKPLNAARTYLLSGSSLALPRGSTAQKAVPIGVSRYFPDPPNWGFSSLKQTERYFPPGFSSLYTFSTYFCLVSGKI